MTRIYPAIYGNCYGIFRWCTFRTTGTSRRYSASLQRENLDLNPRDCFLGKKRLSLKPWLGSSSLQSNGQFNGVPSRFEVFIQAQCVALWSQNLSHFFSFSLLVIVFDADDLEASALAKAMRVSFNFLTADS